jgi:predicted phosphodiesterase
VVVPLNLLERQQGCGRDSDSLLVSAAMKKGDCSMDKQSTPDGEHKETPESRLQHICSDRFIPELIREKLKKGATEPITESDRNRVVKSLTKPIPNKTDNVESRYELIQGGRAERVLNEMRSLLGGSLTEDMLKEMIHKCLYKLRQQANLQALKTHQKKMQDQKNGHTSLGTTPALLRVISVCSDVHLGTKYSKRDDFYNWLKDRRSDETVVLLGDILDFWIFSKSDNRGHLVNRVVAEWEILWKELRKLHDNGTTFHYVPGNHDAFVFFIETAVHFPWSRAVMKRSKEFQLIRDKTKAMRMTEVASIHYPFLQLPVGSQKILFTHGHYSTWGWRQLAGISDLDRESILFLTTASIVLAHKNARILRRFVNEKDWLTKVHGIEDTAISITNAIVRAYEGALRTLGTRPQNAVKLIDLALSVYFGGKPAITMKKEIEIRDALLALSNIQGPNVPKDMEAIWDDTMKYLKDGGSARNVHLDVSSAKLTSTPHFTRFVDFVNPAPLVFGHHHEPRQHDQAYDVGGFVHPHSTSFNIRADGSIDRIS